MSEKKLEEVTDDQILTEAARHLGEMHVENAGISDILSFARAILALRPERVPMNNMDHFLETSAQEAAQDSLDSYIRYSITAQSKKEAEAQQPATPEPVVVPFVATYSSESIGGKQHDTGRVNKGPRGGFFASTASVEDASLIADALNAYTHPAPGVPADVVRDAERYRWLRLALVDREKGVSHHFCSIRYSEELDEAIDAAVLTAKEK